MKRIFTLLTFLFTVFLFSQELKYEEVVKVDSTAKKDELFYRARTWAGQTFSEKNNLITTEDRETGEISGVAIYDYRTEKGYYGFECAEGPVSYKFSIFVKDGRYKYLFYSFVHTGSGGPSCRQVNYGPLTLIEKAPLKGSGIADDRAWADVKEKTMSKIQSLVSGLKNSMNKKYESSNEW
ncbi:DUF4468 domain-containing protein [Chryseobacterium indologenes]|nr:DUF4468 domain-containing protein [Chryseobacterium indologenes]